MPGQAKCTTANGAGTLPAGGAAGGGFGRGLRWVLGLLAGIHLAVAAVFIANQVGHREIMTCSDAWHMGYFLQFAEGGHCYYPKGDYEHLTDGYTPLASQVFGWTIRAFGPDIRAVRAVAAGFGVLGMVLAGLCTAKLSGSRFSGFVAAGLAAALEPRWFVDVGPNTVHAA